MGHTSCEDGRVNTANKEDEPMKTGITNPEPKPENVPTPRTYAEMVAKYRTEHKEQLTNVVNVVANHVVASTNQNG